MFCPSLRILTGPVRSGKTTSLLGCLSGRPGVSGVLCPDVDGFRRLYDIERGTYHQLQIDPCAEHPQGDCVSVGRYVFSHESFAVARVILRRALETGPRLLVVDEVGKLELRGSGYEPLVSEIVAASAAHACSPVLLVVRDSLVREVASTFGIEGYATLDTASVGEYVNQCLA
jgi:nucleoside-triphosphatase THEP1